MNNPAKLLTAIITGAAVGAIAGLLFAPGKGTETRKKINEEGNRVAGELKDKFIKGKEKLGSMKDNLTKSVKEKVESYS